MFTQGNEHLADDVLIVPPSDTVRCTSNTRPIASEREGRAQFARQRPLVAISSHP